ncbi:hypothetical protein F4703DRAFT_1947375 [Phycomyces blakesleeanus]
MEVNRNIRWTSTGRVLYITLGLSYLQLSLAQTFYRPLPRWAAGCGLIPGTLYCYGGEESPGRRLNSLLALNLKKPWSITAPEWREVPFKTGDTSDDVLIKQPGNLLTEPIPMSYFDASSLPDGYRIVTNGGSTVDAAGLGLRTLIYDTKTNQWSAPMYGKAVKSIGRRRKQHTSTIDAHGHIWMWGGTSDNTTSIGPTVYYDSWVMVDSNTWTYSYPIPQNAPPLPRIDHSATLINGNQILIMGGMTYARNVTDPDGNFALNPVSMGTLLVYDIVSSRWSNISAGGNIPAPRRGHSAVLSSDGLRVILFGGGRPLHSDEVFNDVFILELDTMRWTAPFIGGVPPTPRKYHKDDLMLIVFGLDVSGKGSSDTGILSIAAGSWITQYTPNNLLSAGGSDGSGLNGQGRPIGPYGSYANHYSNIKAGIVAGIICAIVIMMCGSSVVLFGMYLYRRKKTYNENASSNAIDPETYGHVKYALPNEIKSSSILHPRSPQLTQDNYDKPNEQSLS